MGNDTIRKPVGEPHPLPPRTIYPDCRYINHSFWYRLIVTGKEETTEIRYKMAVRFIKPLTETTALISIERMPDDVYINDRHPDLPVDMLAYETGQIFYPLLAEVSAQMKWLGIRNREQIVRRWEKKLPNLRQCYTGEEAGRYLDRMSKKIASQTSFDRIFTEDLFIRVYFRGLYADEPSPSGSGVSAAFPVGDYGIVRYEVKRLINRTDDGKKEVIQTGTEIRTQTEADSGQDPPGTYTSKYVLDAETNCIREMEAEWCWESSVKKKIRVILFPLRQSVSTVSSADNEIFDEKEKKKGFFSRLFGE